MSAESNIVGWKNLIMKKKRNVSVNVGYNCAGDTYSSDLKMEKIENQVVINAILELGPEPFSSCKMNISKKIKYRSYPKWYISHLNEKYEQEREITSIPDIVAKIMNSC